MDRLQQKVSILIPAYNAAKYIVEAINSAIRQSWVSIEIIIVDDGSTDNTLALAKSVTDPRITVISQENKGAAAARNLAFKASTGSYIQYLDADDLLDGSKIEQQMSLANQFGDEYMYSCSWRIFNADLKDAKRIDNILLKDYEHPINWLKDAWQKQVWIQPGAWLTPRRLIETSGGWNEDLSLHDDGEFFCRVLLKSKGIKFSKQSIVYYRKTNEASLSNTVTEKAIISHFAVCELYEKHLLDVDVSDSAKLACAINYIHFHYTHFPFAKQLRERALKSAARLGATNTSPVGTELFHLIRKIAGWKVARILERFYYRYGLNRAALKRRLNLS